MCVVCCLTVVSIGTSAAILPYWLPRRCIYTGTELPRSWFVVACVRRWHVYDACVFFVASRVYLCWVFCLSPRVSDLSDGGDGGDGGGMARDGRPLRGHAHGVLRRAGQVHVSGSGLGDYFGDGQRKGYIFSCPVCYTRQSSFFVVSPVIFAR